MNHAEAGSVRGVSRILASGWSVEGTGKYAFTPLMVAANAGQAAVVDLLLEKGANLEAAVSRNGEGKTWYKKGARSLHIAAGFARLDAFRALLQAGADVNACDAEGRTPLMYACNVVEGEPSGRRAEIARALLDSGADPFFRAADCGSVAMHFAATHANEDVIDALFSASPSTVNMTDTQGYTPLCSAAGRGNERTVSHLLSLGASDVEAVKRTGWNALNLAGQKNRLGVSRVLVETGLGAIGGLEMIPHGIVYALKHPRIVELLLEVEGEDRRQHWATCWLQGLQMLHYAAAYCALSSIPVLLALGADETSTEKLRGQTAIDVIGVKLPPSEIDEALEDAIDRTLQRGPAYRARSWMYPVTIDGAADATDPARQPTEPVGVEIFRPKCITSNRCFTTRLAR